MDDLDPYDLNAVKQLRRTVRPITNDAMDHARQRLLAKATAPRPPRRHRMVRAGWRLAAAAALAIVMTVGVKVAQNVGVDHTSGEGGGQARGTLPGLPATPVANAAELLERAASVVSTRHTPGPRPGQWIYFKDRFTTGQGPGGVVTSGPYHSVTNEYWRPVDGTAVVRVRDGKIVSFPPGGPSTWPPRDTATIRSLPTDPDALLAWIYRKLNNWPGLTGGTAEGRYQFAYSAINVLLRDNVLTPSLQAAMYRALARIPGVTLVKGIVDAAGRRAVALGRIEAGWLQEQVLLDGRTYQYLGERAVAIRDHQARALDGSWHIRAGTLQRQQVRIDTAIVDHAGDRP